MSSSPLHISVRQLTSVPGHQEMPAKFNFASDVGDQWVGMERAGKRPPGPALWGDEAKWNFRAPSEMSQRAASVLSGPCSLQHGDLVAVVLLSPEWWLVTLGCMRAGLVFMPGTIQMKSKAVLYRLRVSKTRAIVAGDEVAHEVDTVAADCPALRIKLLVSERSQDRWLDLKTLLKEASTIQLCVESRSQEVAAIHFTNGTSGLRKMAEHSHVSLCLKGKMNAGSWTGLQASDLIWTISDTGWIMNILTTLLEPWTLGACIFIHLLPKSDPQTILKVLSSYPINSMVGTPLVYRVLLQQDLSSYKFPHLKNSFSGGESLCRTGGPKQEWTSENSMARQKRTCSLGTVGWAHLGLTCRISSTMTITGYLETAVPHCDVQVIDDEGNILPPGKEGNIAIRVKPIRPVGIFSEYNNPKKTAANVHGDFWLLGDQGIKDQDRYFQFLGRGDDIINSSGYQMGPSEVENAQMERLAMAETAVVSSPDPVQGEVVKAFVVLTSHFLSHDKDQLTRELQKHMKSVMAPYKNPRKLEFVLDLPKTIMGKISREKLLAMEWKTSEQAQAQ
ncbi:LOW QUALITY PROTEIN: acyl-coenzyme A synthetase ACSM2B, mitochondrial-like [Erethizon dorsatum]